MLAQLYHLHHKEYTEDIPYWLSLAKQAEGSILELGCGTGRVLRPLAEAGFTITGLDLDTEMLTHPNLANLPNTTLIQADMTNFDLREKFGLIILPCNTFSTLDTAQRQKLLACVKQHLQPGGMFATSLPNPILLDEIEDEGEPEFETDFPHPVTGDPVLVRSSWRREGTQVKIIWDYDHLLPDGQVERNPISTTHYPTTSEKLEKEFAQLRFQTQLYGDFDQNKFDEDSFSLVIEARLT